MFDKLNDFFTKIFRKNRKLLPDITENKDTMTDPLPEPEEDDIEEQKIELEESINGTLNLLEDKNTYDSQLVFDQQPLVEEKVSSNENKPRKLYRYMGEVEFIKMSLGMDMQQENDFERKRTNSKGFCFLGEKTVGYKTYYNVSTTEFVEHIMEMFNSYPEMLTNEFLLRAQKKMDDIRSLIDIAYSIFGAETCHKMLDEYIEKIEDRQELDEYTPIEFLEFLSGIVDKTVLVEFEVDDNTDLKEGYGFYATEDYGRDWIYNPNDLQKITEYSCEEYNKETLKPKRWLLAERLIEKLDYGEEIVWEDYDPNKFTTIRDFRQHMQKEHRFHFLSKLDDLKFLPPLNPDELNESWFWDKENNCLSYGNQVSGSMKFQIQISDDGFIRKTGDVPEILNEIKYYDPVISPAISEKRGLSNIREDYYMYIALLVQYPQISERFLLGIDGHMLELKSKVDNTSIRIYNLSFEIDKDGDMIPVDYLEFNGKNILSLDSQDEQKSEDELDNSIFVREHTAEEIKLDTKDVSNIINILEVLFGDEGKGSGPDNY